MPACGFEAQRRREVDVSRLNRKSKPSLLIAGWMLMATSAYGATATFTPIGPTTVAPGTPVSFTITVSATPPSVFDAADIVIGSNDASSLSFSYSTAWQAAFGNVTPPTPVMRYAQDVFVGGNNTTPVGTSLALGTVTLQTDGMTEGTFDVRIDPDVGPDVSSLVLAGQHEGLSGLGQFTVVCETFDPQCDSDVDLSDFTLFQSCMAGPIDTATSPCLRFDANGDSRIDLADLHAMFAQFTGAW